MNAEAPDDDRTVSQPITPARSAPAVAAPAARQDSGNALPIGTYLDEFELRSVAGEGGFSIVYRAWDHSLKRQVAVKEYFPSGMVGRSGGTQVVVRSERHADAFEAGLKAFVKEAQLLAQFDHPALIKVYRFWRANGSAYMVMPFCEGITLRDDWRSKPEPPDEAALMGLLDPLTEALAVLHAERWYHRDIAPDNVMLLAGTRRPLLLDFGAARQVIGDMTHALTVILKPGYAPIEQWGEVPGMKQGPWTDVYALAALIHFGIMRRTPPPSVGRLVNDGYEPLAVVAAGRYSDRFLRAVDHALAVRPEHRTQTIEQFRDEIGLNDLARERTMTWMQGSQGGTTARPSPTQFDAQPVYADSEPTVVAPVSQPSTALQTPQFTQPHLPQADWQTVQASTQFPPAPPSSTGSAMRNPALLFVAGLLATGVLGLVAYAVFKPAPVDPDKKLVVVDPKPPPDPASGAKPDPKETTPPPPPPPPPTPVFDAVADFNRILSAQTPGRAVEVSLVRTTVRSEKDDISFTVKSQQDGHLYVFNHGSDGSLLQLYPNKAEGAVRVRKDVAMNLPRSADVKFTISGPSGVNHLLIVVSQLQRDHSSFAPRNDGGFNYFPTGDAALTLTQRHKGPLPWIAGLPKCPTSGACNDEFGAAVATFNVVQ